jgi:hypothetical protein
MSETDTRARLQAVSSGPAPSPLPDVGWLCEQGPRRPGELHETVAFGGEAERQLERSASAGRVSPSLAARLLLEAALLRRDLQAAGAARADGLLDHAAGAARVCRRLSAGEADYLRALRMASHPERTGAVTVPVRLLARLEEVDLAAALGGDARQAVSWEAAALMAGRTMLEWGLLRALRRPG